MPRAKKKYHYLYKTTNLINEKYYYGMHSTSNLNDEYLGSGTYLRRSIRKHGKENFKLEIIKFYKDRDELKDAEKNLITEDIVKEPLCMNLKPGGYGGFNNKEHQLKCSLAGANAPGRLEKTHNTLRYRLTDLDYKKKYSDKIKYGMSINIFTNGFKDKKHTEESKQKIGNANSIKQKGENNSQYNTCWIMNDIENKKIKLTDLNIYLDQGWIKGRKIIKQN